MTVKAKKGAGIKIGRYDDKELSPYLVIPDAIASRDPVARGLNYLRCLYYAGWFTGYRLGGRCDGVKQRKVSG